MIVTAFLQLFTGIMTHAPVEARSKSEQSLKVQDAGFALLVRTKMVLLGSNYPSLSKEIPGSHPDSLLLALALLDTK